MSVNDFLNAMSLGGVVPVLVGALAQGTAILLLGAVCTLVARNASAATRHLIWTLTLTGAMVAPIASPFLPRLSVPVPHWPQADWLPATAPVAARLPAGEQMTTYVATPAVAAEVISAAPSVYVFDSRSGDVTSQNQELPPVATTLGSVASLWPALVPWLVGL